MTDARTLYALLPALYRRRDAKAGHALQALCEVLDGAATATERDIGALYDNWFVETCEPAALPLIGRLVGLDALPEGAFDPRLLVADAIAFARRKGTVPALEHRLSALSGWPVQIDYSVPKRLAIARYWPDPAFPLRRTPPRADGNGRFRFHPLGIDSPLFAAPRPRRGIEMPFVEQEDAPRPLERTRAALDALSILTADGDSFKRIDAADMAVADLTEWTVPSDPRASAIVDPLLGRFILRGVAAGAPVAVSFAYPSAGTIGGGPYPRSEDEGPRDAWMAFVDRDAMPERPASGPAVFANLSSALAAYATVGGNGRIRILDSGAYDLGSGVLDADALPCASAHDGPRRLAIEALCGETPVLIGNLVIAGGVGGLELSLAGLWIDGQIVLSGRMAARLEHCTVHPPAGPGMGAAGQDIAPALRFAGAVAGAATIDLDACLVGPLDLSPGVALEVADSVVDGGGSPAIRGAAAASLVRTTVLGDCTVSQLDATDSLLAGTVTIGDPSAAGFRNCALVAAVPGAHAVHCVVGSAAWGFRSTRFGQAGYARLKRPASDALVAGASNGSEIGAFNGERASRREQLIIEGLAENLPLGLRGEIEPQ